jgi:hypothetical protein
MYQVYQWLVFIHVAAVFIFLMAHGVSALVVFRVAAERNLEALRTLLGLSALASMVSMAALAVLVLAGIGATFAGSLALFGWPWASLLVLIAVSFSMSFETGSAMRRLRQAAGFTSPMEIGAPAKPEELAAAQAAIRPWVSTTIGGAGLLILLWLMVFQPF